LYTEFEIYNIFRQEQATHFSRGFRLPKNWDTYFEKMNEKQKTNLISITRNFNTKWQNIDPKLYFSVGFELFKNSFSYHKFFDVRITKHYISRDKVQKRDSDNVKEDFSKSLKHVRNIISESDTILLDYTKLKIENQSLPVYDFLHNNIGKYFLTQLIRHKYLILNETEKLQLPLITANYREYLYHIKQSKKE